MLNRFWLVEIFIIGLWNIDSENLFNREPIAFFGERRTLSFIIN